MEHTTEPVSLLGESAVMQHVREEIRLLATVDVPVLIEGETGTGKTLVARAIHVASRRRHGPFVSAMNVRSAQALLVDPGFAAIAMPAGRAATARVNVFEAAQGGTVLLEAIGEMPLRTQGALLRIMEATATRDVHERAARPLDVRVLATTHHHLERAVAEGRFRQDLFYRIRVARIVLPLLRQRPEDIAALALAFVQRAAATHGRDVEAISPDALKRLEAYRWPGNVRELASAIEAAVIRAAGPTLGAADLPLELLDGAHPEEIPKVRQSSARDRHRLLDALERAGGNRSAAARLLGIGRATLYRRLAKLDAGDSDS